MSANARLALGTVQFGLDYGIANTSGQVSAAEANNILSICEQEGIDLLDTASLYGNSETVLGQLLASRSGKFKVVSKLPDCSAEEVRKAFGDSLEHLQQEKLYGYLIHHYGHWEKNLGIFDELQALREENKVDKVGFSLYHPQEAMTLLDRGIVPDLVQVPFSLFDQRFNEVFSALKAAGTEIHVRSVFLQGVYFMNPENLPEHLLPAKRHLMHLGQVAKREGLSIADLCLNFALGQPLIDRVVIGVDSSKILNDNIVTSQKVELVKSLFSELKDFKLENDRVILPYLWPQNS